MKIESLEDISGVWKCFINGMQNHSKKTDFNYIEVSHFANQHKYSIKKTECEYIVLVFFMGITYEFRNNHYARKNNI